LAAGMCPDAIPQDTGVALAGSSTVPVNAPLATIRPVVLWPLASFLWPHESGLWRSSGPPASPLPFDSTRLWRSGRWPVSCRHTHWGAGVALAGVSPVPVSALIATIQPLTLWPLGSVLWPHRLGRGRSSGPPALRVAGSFAPPENMGFQHSLCGFLSSYAASKVTRAAQLHSLICLALHSSSGGVIFGPAKMGIGVFGEQAVRHAAVHINASWLLARSVSAAHKNAGCCLDGFERGGIQWYIDAVVNRHSQVLFFQYWQSKS